MVSWTLLFKMMKYCTVAHSAVEQEKDFGKCSVKLILDSQ